MHINDSPSQASTRAESTGPYRAEDDPSPTPPRAPVAMVGKPGASALEDLTGLLRRRMRVLALVCLCLLPVIMAGALPGAIATGYWVILSIFGVLLLLAVACNAVLWSRRSLSLFQL